MNLQEYIKQMVQQELDEMSVSGDVGAYLTPKAFAKKGQGKNAATKYAEKMGFELAKKPTTSKVVDYKKIFEAGTDEVVATLNNPNLDPDVKKTLFSAYRQGHITADGVLAIVDLVLKKNTNPSEMNETLLNIINQELLNEVTYGKFKKDVKHRTKSEQLHKAIREVKRKLQEIDRIVEYTSRMKQELSEDGGINYWKATQKNVATISEMVNQLNNKIKNLNQ